DLTSELAAALKPHGLPTLNVSATYSADGVPLLRADDTAAGEMAAGHFLQRGLRTLAFFGNPTLNPSVEHWAGYSRAAGRAGAVAICIDTARLPPVSDLRTRDVLIAEWITELPKPVGLLVGDDDLGMWISQLCRQAGCHVPTEVALLGINDDTLNCELANPHLSSVAIPRERIGYLCGEMLGRMMHGRRKVPPVTLIPPGAVTERASSDMLATDDPDFVAAVRYIREHADEPISVWDVVKSTAASRRGLEQKFQRILGKSPLRQIRLAHLEQAKQLLASTSLPLKTVAERSGFIRPQHLCGVFRREMKMTPSAYRRRLEKR
ncbi:MAG TPA: substrate-binding domain-containing protein, partial [Tepidisphaeraceae bacterium]